MKREARSQTLRQNPVRLREDYSAADLRRLAKTARTASASRRMLSLALVLEGVYRDEAAKAGGMDRQTLCDWVHRFNAKGPEGLYNKPRPGPACRLSKKQQQELAAIIEAGPDLIEHDRQGHEHRRRCPSHQTGRLRRPTGSDRRLRCLITGGQIKGIAAALLEMGERRAAAPGKC